MLALNASLAPTVVPMLRNSLSKLEYFVWPTTYFDDHLWFVLAWLRVHEVTGDDAYRAMAQRVLDGVLAYNPWGAGLCGGMLWNNGSTTTNAITNGLLWQATTRLALLDPVGYARYGALADQVYTWLLHKPNPLFTGTVFLDTLENCSAVTNTSELWTYNQGIMLGAMHFYARLRPRHRLHLAGLYRAVARTTLAVFGDTSCDGLATGVLLERDCSPTDGCDHDATQFKGVTIRHLAYSLDMLAPVFPSAQAAFSLFYNQTVALRHCDAVPAPGAPGTPSALLFGPDWRCLTTTVWQSVSQGAALDAFNAASLAMHQFADRFQKEE